MTKKKRTKKTVWFKPVRGSYLPASTAGWLTYIPFVSYLIFSVIIAFRDIDSRTLAALFVLPNWIAATAVMTYIAARKS